MFDTKFFELFSKLFLTKLLDDLLLFDKELFCVTKLICLFLKFDPFISDDGDIQFDLVEFGDITGEFELLIRDDVDDDEDDVEDPPLDVAEILGIFDESPSISAMKNLFPVWLGLKGINKAQPFF